ncbi:MAG: HEPN domain-containing protein [bacterium]|nr:HEPN domain-containing protein [bacterium]
MDRSQDWMEDAARDLEHARASAEGGHYNWSCFAAQQGAGKAVKALCQRLGAVAWGHSVADLLRELPGEGSCAPALVRKALELDKAYVGARYADAHPRGSASSRYTPEEAERMLGYAEEVVRFCQDLLSGDKPPGRD